MLEVNQQVQQSLKNLTHLVSCLSVCVCACACVTEVRAPLPQTGLHAGRAAEAIWAAAGHRAGLHRHHRLGGGRQAHHGEHGKDGKRARLLPPRHPRRVRKEANTRVSLKWKSRAVRKYQRCCIAPQLPGCCVTKEANRMLAGAKDSHRPVVQRRSTQSCQELIFSAPGELGQGKKSNKWTKL